jgi:hypothetical protein
MESLFTITIDKPSDDFNDIYHLKIQNNNSWEINIRVNKEELLLIPNIKFARDDRTTLKIGTCVDAPVFWSCENGYLSLLIGSDDECWDFGVFLPENEFENIISELKPFLEN